MVNKKLTNVGDGTDPNDAVTKKQHDSVGGGHVTKNIDLKHQDYIVNSKTRTFQQLKANDESLVNFEEVKENFVGIHEAEPMKTHLDMGNNFIYNVKTAAANDQAANKAYVDKEITDSETASSMTYATKMELGNYLKKDGSVLMTGDLNINSEKITHLLAPTSDTGAANKKYMDQNKVDVSNYLKLDGTTQMTGDLNMAKGDEVTLKDCVLKLINDLPDVYLDRAGSLKMKGDLDVNTHRIKNLIDNPKIKTLSFSFSTESSK